MLYNKYKPVSCSITVEIQHAMDKSGVARTSSVILLQLAIMPCLEIDG